MNMLAAMFLLVADGNEDDAFWLLVALMHPCRMAPLFADGLAALQVGHPYSL